MKPSTAVALAFLLPSTLFAQLVPYNFDPASNDPITDIAIASAKSGILHAITTTKGSSVRSYTFLGEKWEADLQIDTVEGEDNTSGIDIASDASGGLHASYYSGDNFAYAYRAPGESRWVQEFIPEFDDTGLAIPKDSAHSTRPRTFNAPDNDFRRSRSRTSIAVQNTPNGPIPHIVYTASVSESEGTFWGIYSEKSSSGRWISAPIRTPDNQIIRGELLVVTLGSIPRDFAEPDTSGITIAYYEDGEFRMTDIGTTGKTAWSTPLKIANAPALGAPDRIELDLAISGDARTLHAVCNGTFNDIDSGLLYYKRTLSTSGVANLVGQKWEEVTEGAQELTFDAATVQAVSLALAPDGSPHVATTLAFEDPNDLRRHSSFRYKRTGEDSWVADIALRTSAGDDAPFASDIVFDSLSRPTIIGSRPSGSAASAHSEEIPYFSESIADTDSLQPGEIATTISAKGSSGTVYETADGNASFRYAPPGADPITIPLEVGRIDANQNHEITAVGIASNGTDHFYVVTQYKSDDGGGKETITSIQETTSIFEGSTLIATDATVSVGSGPFQLLPSQFTLSGSAQAVTMLNVEQNELAGAPTNATLRTFPSETPSFPQTDPSFAPANSIVGRVASASFGDAHGFIGRRDDRIVASFTTGSAPYTRTLIADSSDDPAALPQKFAIAVNSDEAFVVFLENGTIQFARFEGDSTDPIDSITLSSGIAEDTNLSLNFTASGELQLVQQTASGLISYTNYELPPGSPVAIKRGIISGTGTETASIAFDRFGFLQAATVVGNEFRLFSSPIATDEDCDGLPLFQELALCRDPKTPDHNSILDIEVSPNAAGSGLTSSAIFERPAIIATAENGVIFCGPYRYEVQTSIDLTTWLPPADGTTASTFPSTGDAPRIGIGSNNGYLQAVSTIIPAGNASFPKFFQRLKVRLR